MAVVGGFSGRDRELPAYDLLAQAMSGLMSVTGERRVRRRRPAWRCSTCWPGWRWQSERWPRCWGRRAERERRAPAVEVSLMEASVAALGNVLANHLATGEEPRRWGNAHPNIVPYQSFATRDGHVAIAVGNDAQFARLLEVLGLDAEGRYATNAERVAARARAGRRGSAAAIERARARRAGGRAARRGRARRSGGQRGGGAAQHGGGPRRALGAGRRRPCAWPPTRSGSTGRAHRFAASRHCSGEHTDEVLTELGLSPAEIATAPARRGGRLSARGG